MATDLGRTVLEIIALSADDCKAAEAGGANRIELCSAIELGGLTPSHGLIVESVGRTGLPIMAMIRPRTGGFCYHEAELAAMHSDIENAIDAGAAGVVFGVLSDHRTIDIARNKELVDRAGTAQAVFHRAFDVLSDPFEGLEQLIDLGFRRVLTSGGHSRAWDGRDTLKRLIDHAGDRIEVMPGGGIRSDHVGELVRLTGAGQIHMSAFGERQDPSMRSVALAFNGRTPKEDGFIGVDGGMVRSVVSKLGPPVAAR